RWPSRVLMEARKGREWVFGGRTNELVTAGGVLDNDMTRTPIRGVNLWARAHGTSRNLDVRGPGYIRSVKPCLGAPRLCIEYRDDSPGHGKGSDRLSIVDAQDGKEIRNVDWTRHDMAWGISENGCKLLCMNQPDGHFWLVCLDVDTGQRLYEAPDWDATMHAFISPDGRYLAVSRSYWIQDVIDLVSRQEVAFGPGDGVNSAAAAARHATGA